MDDNVLAALSGFGGGTVQALQLFRKREAQQEEQERRERDRQVKFFQSYIGGMKKDVARKLLEQSDLGDDDKMRLMAIAETDVEKEEVPLTAIEDKLQDILEEDDQGISNQKKYDFMESLILQRGDLNKGEKELWLERFRRKFDIQKTTGEKGYEYEDWREDWVKAKTKGDREGLRRYAEKHNPGWLNFVGEDFAPTTQAQGRTEEEIIDDQSRLISRRIRDIDATISRIQKHPDYTEDSAGYAELKRKEEKLIADRQFLVDKESELAQPGAKPFKNFKKALTRPKKKRKEFPIPFKSYEAYQKYLKDKQANKGKKKAEKKKETQDLSKKSTKELFEMLK